MVSATLYWMRSFAALRMTNIAVAGRAFQT
jgi:hypothetical protein